MVLTCKIFFDSKEDLFEAIRYWFTPDIISMFQGRAVEDFFGELKLFLWIGATALGAYGGYGLFA